MATSRATHTSGNGLLPSTAFASGTSDAANRPIEPRSQFLALPLELQKTILEYVRASVPSFHVRTYQLTILQLSTNSDKKSACLTCKQWQSLATPSLYEHIEIAGERLDSRFKKNFNTEHTGLKYIRTLRIKHPLPTFVSAEVKAISALCRLLVAMPKHSLTSLEYVCCTIHSCTSI